MADRVTFTTPHRPRGSLLSRYQASASTEPTPNPYRFIQNKLGLTKAEFHEKTSEDVNDLADIELNRRQEFLEPLPYERVLTKEDCLQMFHENGQPTSGSFLGVYKWAADLGHSRFNFEWDWNKDDINVMNAYD